VGQSACYFLFCINILDIHENNILEEKTATAKNKMTVKHRICLCKSARLGINGLTFMKKNKFWKIYHFMGIIPWKQVLWENSHGYMALCLEVGGGR
jgi:hypothetical protein